MSRPSQLYRLQDHYSSFHRHSSPTHAPYAKANRRSTTADGPCEAALYLIVHKCLSEPAKRVIYDLDEWRHHRVASCRYWLVRVIAHRACILPGIAFITLPRVLGVRKYGGPLVQSGHESVGPTLH